MNPRPFVEKQTGVFLFFHNTGISTALNSISKPIVYFVVFIRGKLGIVLPNRDIADVA